jgi:hypothetical protein
MKIREIIGFPFMFFGWIVLMIGMLIGFGYKVTKEFNAHFNKVFN